MADYESTWDASLQIKTVGRDDTNADAYHHPYEPTPYSVLDRLAKSGFFGPQDVVLDYGCGKGRVGFFLAYRTKARTVGIEYDTRIYADALENRATTISRIKPDFMLTRISFSSRPVRSAGRPVSNSIKLPSFLFWGIIAQPGEKGNRDGS